MPNYLDVVYNKKDKSVTDYPNKLCEYLFLRFKMKKANKILDAGSGRGDFLEAFKKLELDAQGIDLKDCDFESEPFPFQDSNFDFVFSKSVIEHLKNPENFISEIRRVLKPDGKIIIMTPDWKSQCLIFYDDYTHVRPYTETGIKDFLEISGFKNIKTEIFYQLPFLWKNAWLKKMFKLWKIFGPVKRVYKNKFIRWSRELMVLAHAEK